MESAPPCNPTLILQQLIERYARDELDSNDFKLIASSPHKLNHSKPIIIHAFRHQVSKKVLNVSADGQIWLYAGYSAGFIAHADGPACIQALVKN